MPVTFHNRFSKWLQNKTNTSLNQTWWKTSFNMPVKYLFGGANYTEAEWFLNSFWTATTFDLTWFQPWWEIMVCDTVFDFTWPYAWWYVNMTQTWKKPNLDVIYTNSFPETSPQLQDWYWWFTQIASNIWFAEWEVSWNGRYYCTIEVTGAINQSLTYGFDIINCPSIVAQPTWYIWIEWNDFRFVSANWHVHTVYWTDLWYVDTNKVWAFWIDTADNKIRWVGANWHKYCGKYNFLQFASAFSNWPNPGTVSWQLPWYIWMDSNFWYEHIWYIANTGAKWIFPSWWNPYCNPPASEWP